MKKQRISTLILGLGVLATTGVSYADYNSTLIGGYTPAQLVDILVPVASGLTIVGTPTFNGSSAANTGFNTSRISSLLAGNPNITPPNNLNGTMVGSFGGGDVGPTAPQTGTLGIPFPSGVAITTGFLNTTKTLNDDELKSGELGIVGNSLLEVSSGVVYGPNLANGTTRDAGVLHFQFTVPARGIFSFQYTFASEEYLEFVNPSAHAANDAFAFILTDGQTGGKTNLARIGTTPITVKTVHPSVYDPDTEETIPAQNAGYYADNALSTSPDPYAIEFDGLAGGGDATSLYATAEVVPGRTYSFDIVIADGGSDRRGDSAVYIRENSLQILPPPPDAVPEPSTYIGALALAGLVARKLRRKA